jgi:hypothetical protein
MDEQYEKGGLEGDLVLSASPNGKSTRPPFAKGGRLFNRMLKKSEITNFFLFMNEPHKKKPYF